MIKFVTWNIGSFSFLKYAPMIHFSYRGIPFKHEYFQPKINGKFVSQTLRYLDADIVFLQEIHSDKDADVLDTKDMYPHQGLINTWYHVHSILILSKQPYRLEKHGIFYAVIIGDMVYIPIHLHSFSARKRLVDSSVLIEFSQKYEKCIILGDSNVWNRGKWFLFKDDKRMYRVLIKTLVDRTRHILSSTCVGICLDKVFSTPQLVIKHVRALPIRGAFMDHYPIYGELLDK